MHISMHIIMHTDACDKGLGKRDMYSVVCYVKNSPLLWYHDGLLSFDPHTIWVDFIPKSNKTDLILMASCTSFKHSPVSIFHIILLSTERECSS